VYGEPPLLTFTHGPKQRLILQGGRENVHFMYPCDHADEDRCAADGRVVPIYNPLFRHLGSCAYYTEKYVLSVLYLYLSWVEGRFVHFSSLVGTHAAGQEFVTGATHLILFLLQFLIGILLLFSRKPSVHPRNLWEIIVPLAAAMFFAVYRTLPWFPVSWRILFLSAAAHASVARLALVLGLIGPAISTWGVIALGRSFGIFVSVRDIVDRGPYRFVRHPIYLGYLLIWTGYLLLNFCPAVVAIISIHTALFVWRVYLEERRLTEASEAYREYIKRTGAIFPRLSSFLR